MQSISLKISIATIDFKVAREFLLSSSKSVDNRLSVARTGVALRSNQIAPLGNPAAANYYDDIGPLIESVQN